MYKYLFLENVVEKWNKLLIYLQWDASMERFLKKTVYVYSIWYVCPCPVWKPDISSCYLLQVIININNWKLWREGIYVTAVKHIHPHDSMNYLTLSRSPWLTEELLILQGTLHDWADVHDIQKEKHWFYKFWKSETATGFHLN